FNSDNAPYTVGTSTAEGHIQSNGGVTMTGGPLGLLPVNIRGNVTASGNIVPVLSVNVTGTSTQNAPDVEYPAVAPCGPPFPPNTGISGGLYDQALGTLVNVG